MKIILATANKDKVNEMKEILKDLPLQVLSKDEVGLGQIEIVEDGKTLEENSYKKAKTIYDITGEISLADDTGLFVDYLNGQPGINSARYSGIEGDYKANNIKLLINMKDVPQDKRGAYFETVMVLINKEGNETLVHGRCYGRIADEYRGDDGFGYDPIFIPQGYDISFNEMPRQEKNKISHRGRAIDKLRKEIKRLLKDG